MIPKKSFIPEGISVKAVKLSQTQLKLQLLTTDKIIFPELFFTDRLRIDLFTEADAPFIISLLNSKGWIDGIGDRAIRSTSDAEAFIFRINHTELFRYWAVRLKESGPAIGMVSCMKREHLKDFDIGFAFLPEYNGMGYAQEAAQKLLFILKENPRFHRVLAFCVPSNLRSIKLLEKLNFHYQNQVDSGGSTVSLFANDEVYNAFICITCGTQYGPSMFPPDKCLICSDDRQYVNPAGQAWITPGQMKDRYQNDLTPVAENLYAIHTRPEFGIGQRAHLVLHPAGNILWDCITYPDTETIRRIRQWGGIRAIAVSHPHSFSGVAEWSAALGNVPVYINASDEKWLPRKDFNIIYWKEESQELWEGLSLIRCGGHFPGSSVLYVPAGKGQLLVGDTIQVTPGCDAVSFMYSYPNMIPLTKKEIVQIEKSIHTISYHALYGAFGKYITANAKDAVDRSFNRYLEIYR